ncbi:MAG: hypothetical protein ACKPCI_11450, partial [Dolichospermum sp.]
RKPFHRYTIEAIAQKSRLTEIANCLQQRFAIELLIYLSRVLTYSLKSGDKSNWVLSALILVIK